MMDNKINVAVVKKDGRCLFFIDKFPEHQDNLFQTGDKIIFREVRLYEQDADGGLFNLSIKKARALAKEILRKLGDE